MGLLRGRGALLIWVDLDEDIEAEADRWYEQEHFPERITESGYLRARRYRAISSSPGYLGVLEAETPDAMAGEGYRRVTAKINARSQKIRDAFRRIIRSPHAVLNSAGTIDGGVLVSARIGFAGDAQRAAFATWSEAGLHAWHRDHPEVLGVHALAGAPEIRRYMDSFRATGHDDEIADGVLLLEFGRGTDAERVAAELSVEGLRRMGIEAAESIVSTYQLMIDMEPRHFAAAKQEAASGGMR